MRLRKALGISRVFYYRKQKYFALLWVKNQPKGKFTVVCSEHPMPDKTFHFSSEILVKPVIRENASRGQTENATKPRGSITQNPQPDPTVP